MAAAKKEIILKNKENGLQDDLLAGAQKLSDYVSSTLGPKGTNVILYDGETKPIITKDGVTVAKAFELPNPAENMASEVIKQAALETNKQAGDGTTTSTLLAASIYEHAFAYLEDTAKYPPVEIKKGIDKGVEFIVNEIKNKYAFPLKNKEMVENLATISANNDRKIGQLLSIAVDKVGRDGGILVEPGHSVETKVVLQEGFRFPGGLISLAMATDEKRGTLRYKNALLLMTDESVSDIDELMPALEIAAKAGQPLVVIAAQVEGSALAALILNTRRGSMKVTAVKAPKYGEERDAILEDLAIATGGSFMKSSNGKYLKDITLADFGRCDSVEADKFFTTVVGGAGEEEKVESQIEMLKEQLSSSGDELIGSSIYERITRLSSGIAIIKVGGATEVEMEERKQRIEDALEAIKSAQAEGVIVGGGVILGILANALPTELATNIAQQAGLDILQRACMHPFIKMAEHCGMASGDILKLWTDVNTAHAMNPNMGVNFLTGEVVDMYEAGILDPVKVTCCALQNAASAATTLMTTHHAIIIRENLNK